MTEVYDEPVHSEHHSGLDNSKIDIGLFDTYVEGLFVSGVYKSEERRGDNETVAAATFSSKVADKVSLAEQPMPAKSWADSIDTKQRLLLAVIAMNLVYLSIMWYGFKEIDTVKDKVSLKFSSRWFSHYSYQPIRVLTLPAPTVTSTTIAPHTPSMEVPEQTATRYKSREINNYMLADNTLSIKLELTGAQINESVSATKHLYPSGDMYVVYDVNSTIF